MYGSRPIEVAWTVAPVLIVFVLFLIVIRSVAEVRQDRTRQDCSGVSKTKVSSVASRRMAWRRAAGSWTSPVSSTVRSGISRRAAQFQVRSQQSAVAVFGNRLDVAKDRFEIACRDGHAGQLEG